MEDKNQVKLNHNSSSEAMEYNFFWKIPNFTNTRIYSEKLKLQDDVECTIMLIPRVEAMDRNFEGRRFSRSYFTVFFTKVPDDRKVWFNFEVREHFKRRPISTAEFRLAMMTVDGFRGSKNNINSTTWYNYVDKDHTLKMDIKFTLDDLSFNSFNLENFQKERSKLSQDIAMLYKEPTFADMNFICANNEVIPVNKAILASRSPVFAKILNDNIDSYIMSAYNKEVVAEFLRFIYTDTISMNEFNTYNVELLDMANKYEISELAKLCKQDLVYGCMDKMNEIFGTFMNLSCENVAKLKNFAEISRCIKELYKATKNIN